MYPRLGMNINTVKWNSKTVFIGIAILSLALQCFFAFSSMDIYHPDEISQILEPAHSLTFGLEMPNYDPGGTFVYGMRNMLAIYLTTAVMMASKILPWKTPLTYLFSVKLVLLALFNWGFYGMYRLVKSSKSEIGLIAVAMLALYVPFLRFGYRTLSETLSIPFLIWACVWLNERTGKGAFRAGLAVGISVIFRYGSGVVLPFVFGDLLVQKEWKRLGYFIAGAAVMALVLAIDDTLQWGRPFHSVLAYFKYNILSGKSKDFGVQPWYDHVKDLAMFLPWSLWLLFVGFWDNGKPVKKMLSSTSFQMAVFYTVVFSLVAHKEFRFVIPIIPLLVMGISEGFSEVKLQWRKKTAVLALLGLAIFIGQSIVLNNAIYKDPRTGSQYDWVIRNYTNPAFTGLIIIGNVYVGMHSYCHKDIPQFFIEPPYNQLGKIVGDYPQLSHAIVHVSKDTPDLEDKLNKLGFIKIKKDKQVIYFEKRNLYN